MESSSVSVVEVCSGSVSVGINTEVMVNTALLARIELLETENKKLKKSTILKTLSESHFR